MEDRGVRGHASQALLSNAACQLASADHLTAQAVEPVALSLPQQVEEDLHGQPSVRLDM